MYVYDDEIPCLLLCAGVGWHAIDACTYAAALYGELSRNEAVPAFCAAMCVDCDVGNRALFATCACTGMLDDVCTCRNSFQLRTKGFHYAL